MYSVNFSVRAREGETKTKSPAACTLPDTAGMNRAAPGFLPDRLVATLAQYIVEPVQKTRDLSDVDLSAVRLRLV